MKERTGRRRGLKKWAAGLRREWAVLREALADPEMPALPRIVAGIALAYALSPIDLIPDFIPVLGQLDDILIVPALVALSLRLIPKEILERAREKVANPGDAPEGRGE